MSSFVHRLGWCAASLWFVGAEPEASFYGRARAIRSEACDRRVFCATCQGSIRLVKNMEIDFVAGGERPGTVKYVQRTPQSMINESVSKSLRVAQPQGRSALYSQLSRYTIQ